MAKLRSANAYRRLKQPYTRRSRYREISFIKGGLHSKITMFNMGKRGGKFDTRVHIISTKSLNVRSNALEAFRQTVHRYLTKVLAEVNYYFQVKPYPHHVMRENPLAGGAGADRFQTGMRQAFGKPIGLAARVHEGQEIAFLDLDLSNIKVARDGLRRGLCKLPMATKLVVDTKKRIDKVVA